MSISYREAHVQAKAYKGKGMEGSIARWYARVTRKDLDEIKYLAKQLAADLKDGAQILEVAPGPGYLAIELAKLGKYNVTGLDISKTFVEIAATNAQAEGVGVDFRQGDAAHMPFEADRFDQIVCRAAFKNFSEPVLALQEMRRVLRPGGRALIIDLSKDTSPEVIDEYIEKADRGAVNSFVMKWTFRLMLLKRAYTKQDFERFIAQSGFRSHDIQEKDLGFGIVLVK
jgi:ubiquinone/menaquinone biosynthesis C-methylase UbiE